MEHPIGYTRSASLQCVSLSVCFCSWLLTVAGHGTLQNLFLLQLPLGITHGLGHLFEYGWVFPFWKLPIVFYISLTVSIYTTGGKIGPPFRLISCHIFYLLEKLRGNGPIHLSIHYLPTWSLYSSSSSPSLSILTIPSFLFWEACCI